MLSPIRSSASAAGRCGRCRSGSAGRGGRVQRVQAHAVRIVPELGVRVGEEVGPDAGVERVPVGAAVGRLEHAAARHAEVHVRGVARVDQDRVQLRPVGRASCSPPPHASRFGWSLKPSTAAQVRRRRRSGTAPAASRRRTTRPARRRGPASARTRGRRCARRPRANAGGREASVHVRPRSAERNTVGPRCPVRVAASSVRAVARIEHHVVDDVAEEVRALQRPRPARRVAGELPEALAGGDVQRHALRACPRSRPCFLPAGVAIVCLRAPGKGRHATAAANTRQVVGLNSAGRAAIL